jgi:2-pyrone-4,6-dicarboxylate lactonase
MSETSRLMTRPTPAGTDATAADTGWTDCDLDPATFEAHGAAALAALGIKRAVMGRLPPHGASLSPEQRPEQDLIATRFVIDAPPAPDAAMLSDLHARGVRAVRFALADDADRARAQLDRIFGYADRIAPFDWSVELTLGAGVTSLARHEWALTCFPVAICLGGVADIASRRSVDDPDLDFVLTLLQMGRTWIKLSAASSVAPAQDTLGAFVDAALSLRRDRVLWGSGIRAARDIGQHPDGLSHVARALAALTQWIPDHDDREIVLAANPSRLYGFR